MDNPNSYMLNGQPRPLNEAFLSNLLTALEIDDRGVAIEQNGAIVPKSLWANTAIVAGDRIELVQFVGGGL